MCDSHDEGRELRAELLGVVLSIHIRTLVHRIPAEQAYSARGKRREVMVNVTTLYCKRRVYRRAILFRSWRSVVRSGRALQALVERRGERVNKPRE